MWQTIRTIEFLARRGTGQAHETRVPEVDVGLAPSAVGTADGTLNTVGLALLAYGLVQLLAKVIDKMPIGRGIERRSDSGGFGDEDRKRLEKTYELLATDADRVARMQEALREVQEQTRWLAEQRTRTDPKDGEPMWNCRGRLIVDRLDTQQRLVGQALDELREVDKKQENTLRKLRALWLRLGRRRGDKR